MATYRELAKRAKDQKVAKAITAHRWKPAKSGDSLVGLLVAIDEAHSEAFSSDFRVYKFRTDDDLVSFVPGKATDAEVGAFMEVGQVYEITIKGKEKTSQGFMKNVYEVFHIDMSVIEEQ